MTNLLILPRAPVMISGAEPLGRFYLDLNRNGTFEDSASVSNFDMFGNVLLDTTGSSYFFEPAGDPQWVGILERPGQPHSADNHFVSRYAFIAVPVGESLDINAIHNQAVTRTVNPASAGTDGYMRNQGVGSWEINLAAFLADLNTNQWLPGASPYNNYYAYNEPVAAANRGLAFDDARALPSAIGTVSSTATLPPCLASTAILATTLSSTTTSTSTATVRCSFSPRTLSNHFQDPVSFPWAGSDNPNKFYTPDDFFDRAKTQNGIIPPVFGFSDRLNNARTTRTATPTGTSRPTTVTLFTACWTSWAPTACRMTSAS